MTHYNSSHSPCSLVKSICFWKLFGSLPLSPSIMPYFFQGFILSQFFFNLCVGLGLGFLVGVFSWWGLGLCGRAFCVFLSLGSFYNQTNNYWNKNHSVLSTKITQPIGNSVLFLPTVSGDAGDMRRDSTESMAPVHGDSDFSRMDSVASVAPTGRRDSNVDESMPYSVSTTHSSLVTKPCHLVWLCGDRMNFYSAKRLPSAHQRNFWICLKPGRIVSALNSFRKIIYTQNQPKIVQRNRLSH